MAFSRLYCCDSCSVGEAVLTFAEEWADGSPASAPVRHVDGQKVRGLISRLWCPTCECVRPFPLLRLEPPADHPVVAYAEAQRLGLTGHETGLCANCSALLLESADAAPCPRCGDGHLRLTGEWEDAV